MTAKVLVVDDLPPNVKLLEAKLRAEYFEVVTAYSGHEALEIAASEQPDLVLLDVMMPGLDGFETCRRLKDDESTYHIPVVMVTALDQKADLLAGLKAGADDFLTKPVQDVALFARVRSLTRLKQMTDELRHRYAQGAEVGAVAKAALQDDAALNAEVMIITDHDEIPNLTAEAAGLCAGVRFTYRKDARAALDGMRDMLPDMVMVDLGLESYDALRLCAAIRSYEGSRLMPLLALAHSQDMRRLVQALDIGVNDYLMMPVDPQEMAARVRTQLRRQHYVAHLRKAVSESLELSVTDALTGLYNRRYLGTQLPHLFREAHTTGHPLSLMILDLDHFKQVNDTLGHDNGDLVLREIAQRLNMSVRAMDMACRFGGEEFVFVMPQTEMTMAEGVADRLRQMIADDPVPLNGDRQTSVTVSIGVASTEEGDASDTPQALLKRADERLYAAKEAGRNCVIAAA